MFYRYSHFTACVMISLITLCGLLALAVPVRSQETNKQVKIKYVPPRDTPEVNGAKLYQEFCAACHGAEGKGDGPAAPALKNAPTNLTLLSRNNGGKYPSYHVMDVLNNQNEYPAHGSAEMPIWGPTFRRLGGTDHPRGLLRAHNVTDYLKSIQAQ